MELSKIQGVQGASRRVRSTSEPAKNARGKRSGKLFGFPYQWTGRPVYTLRDWWIKDLENDPFIPPECKHKIICGKVFNKPGFDDGSVIQTSTIEDAKGRFVLTTSGSVYRLYGRPDTGYYNWMKKQGIAYDGYEPIKIRTR